MSRAAAETSDCKQPDVLAPVMKAIELARPGSR
jgi:hypothetical protein